MAADGAARAARVDAAKEIWGFAEVEGLQFPKEVPKGWGFSPRWYARWVETAALCKANEVPIRAAEGFEALSNLFKKSGEDESSDGGGLLQLPETPPATLDWYSDSMHLLPKPACVDTWKTDWRFAYSRIAGIAPILIKRVVGGLPDKFPVTPEIYSRATGGKDRLEAAIAEARLYMVDFDLMKGFMHPSGVEYPACMGLFVWLRPNKLESGQFLPVAIQCFQEPGPNNPIFTPQDGWAWMMARSVYGGTEKGFHAIHSHATRSHIVGWALLCSMERSLAAEHPMRVLLEPNFADTVSVVWHTKSVYADDGGVAGYNLLAGECSRKLGRIAVDSLNWNDFAPNRHFELSGTADADALPMYPYRDDALLTWPAVLKFAQEYVNLYYGSDADVAGDTEVAAWCRELASKTGGQINGFGVDNQLNTRAQLAEFAAQIMFMTTVYHAAINHALWDNCGMMPNHPMANWAPPPTEKGGYDEKALLKVLTPQRSTVVLLAFCYQDQFQVVHWLGKYEDDHFVDQRAKDVVDRFNAALVEIEATIGVRNNTRPEAYTVLLPSKVPRSIQI